MIISASIISLNFLKFFDQLSQVKQAGVDWLHIDVMDGSFVPNITIGSMFLPFCQQAVNMPLDVHLMINHPEHHIESFIQKGADFVSIHIENNPPVVRTLQQIRSLGSKAGIVLNPGTPPESISELLPFVDLILVMTVNPGYSGQNFLPEMLPKISKIRQMIDQSNYKNVLLQVDGGINARTIKPVIDAGADVVVSASAIFNHPDGIESGVNALRTGH